MKHWKEESQIDYKNKLFGYGSFLKKEKDDSLFEIYNKGYLPMSENEKSDGRFYEARSLRVNLKDFVLSSENKRVLKKFKDTFERKEFPIKQFNVSDKTMRKLCIDYFKNIYFLNDILFRGLTVRETERLARKNAQEKIQNIFNTNLVTHVVVYSRKNIPKAYVYLIKDNNNTHYWHSCFADEFVKKSFGIYLMLTEILYAKEMKMDYMYLGTGYGKKARYKLNFQPLEFWDGNIWIKDEKKFKKILKEESV